MKPLNKNFVDIVDKPGGIPSQVPEPAKKPLTTRGHWFHVGDVITIDGIRFRVSAVKPLEIRLKVLPIR